MQDLCHCPFASEITVNRARIFWQLIFTEKQLCVGERGGISTRGALLLQRPVFHCVFKGDLERTTWSLGGIV